MVDAEALVGRQLVKEFDEGEFKGEVVKTWVSKAGTRFYSIVYEDGDKEDVLFSELKGLLVPEEGGEEGEDKNEANKRMRTVQRQEASVDVDDVDGFWVTAGAFAL